MHCSGFKSGGFSPEKLTNNFATFRTKRSIVKKSQVFIKTIEVVLKRNQYKTNQTPWASSDRVGSTSFCCPPVEAGDTGQAFIVVAVTRVVSEHPACALTPSHWQVPAEDVKALLVNQD